MDYGKLFNRAWQIPWQHKFLIGLGVIAGLFNGMGGGSGYRAGDGQISSGAPSLIGPDWNLGGFEAAMILFAILAIAAVILVIALALWVVKTVARGGLVAGVAHVEDGASTGFAIAWRAGWQRVWPLLGISLVPAVPVLLLLLLGIAVFFMAAGFAVISERPTFFLARGMAWAWAGLAILLCGGIFLTLLLGWLRTLAERACILEGLGVWASYRRVLEVIGQNAGSALVLLIVQIGIGLVLVVLAVFPGMLLVLCCLLWPVLILIQGAVTAYFSTLWTLAWREWTAAGTAQGAAPVALDDAGASPA